MTKLLITDTLDILGVSLVVAVLSSAITWFIMRRRK